MARKPALASSHLRDAEVVVTAALRSAREQFGDQVPEEALRSLKAAVTQIRAAARELDRHAAVHGTADKIDRAWGFQ